MPDFQRSTKKSFRDRMSFQHIIQNIFPPHESASKFAEKVYFRLMCVLILSYVRAFLLTWASASLCIPLDTFFA